MNISHKWHKHGNFWALELLQDGKRITNSSSYYSKMECVEDLEGLFARSLKRSSSFQRRKFNTVIQYLRSL